MSRHHPRLDPGMASTMLALLDVAKVHAPGCETAFVRGYCIATAGEPPPSRDPRREADEPVQIGRIARKP